MSMLFAAKGSKAMSRCGWVVPNNVVNFPGIFSIWSHLQGLGPYKKYACDVKVRWHEG